MKRTDKGAPVLSWAMIVRNAEKTLETTLKSIRERTPQAEIVIVDTMSSDNSAEIAKRYADVWIEWRGPNGDWDRERPWFTDAAAARQKSFELSSGKFIGWIDSDDRLPGPEEAERLLRLNNCWKPGADGPNTRIHDGDTQPTDLEELLMQIEMQFPDMEIVFCPYLYSKAKDGTALIWQERERIITREALSRWHWQEAAHEILVPIGEHRAKTKIVLPHLLFVHEREFTVESVNYSIARHFDVLHRQYQAGERTTRRSLYLAAYAQTVCPERELEFINAAHETCTTSLDRFRVMSALGQMYVRHGLFMDALEAFGAATHLRRDLPDAWFHGAESWQKAEDWVRCAEWLEKGLECKCGDVDSGINPRWQAVRYPTILAEAYRQIAKMHTKAGSHDQAVLYMERAVSILAKVRDDSAIGPDKAEAAARYQRFYNDYEALHQARSIHSLCDYLIRNDEPVKALDVVQSAPWNLQDHPLIVDTEVKLLPVDIHATNEDSYREFYSNYDATGYVSSPEKWLDEKTTVLDRVPWIIEWIRKNKPNARILDVGCLPEGKVIMGDMKPCEICDIKIGDTVLGMSGKTEVTQVFKRDFNGDLVCLRMQGYGWPIRFTPNHPLPVVTTLRGCTHVSAATRKTLGSFPFEWLRADQIQRGDLIVLSRKFDIGNIGGAVDTYEYFQDLNAGCNDKEIISLQQNRHDGEVEIALNCKPIPRHLPLNKDLGRLVGYFIAEGSADGLRNSSINVVFAEHEVEYVDDFIMLVNRLTGLEAKIRNKLKAQGRTTVLRVASRLLCHLLVKFVGRGARNKHLPKWAFENKDVLTGLLCGIFRGDGTTIENDCMKFDTTSEALAYQIKYGLHILGVPSSMIHENPRRTGLCKDCNTDGSYSVRIYGQHARKKLSELIDEPEVVVSDDAQNRWIIDDDRILVRVNDLWVEKFSGPVYNLETEDHTYTIGGISVHNSFDGIVGIAIMRACPDVTYVGFDLCPQAIESFQERLQRFNLTKRAKLYCLSSLKAMPEDDGSFNVALWCEVIEHVQNPALEMRKIGRYLKPGGSLFMTTPWGSFDAGHPPLLTAHGKPRDSRGHLRVLNPHETWKVFDIAGFECHELYQAPAPLECVGDALHARGVLKTTHGKNIVFAVPSALWDWNGNTVHKQGMGASEKSIVQIGEALAESDQYRKVAVYGPVPEPCVTNRVGYWPREQLRYEGDDHHATLIVSRCPSYVRTIKNLDKRIQKILWLQDAYYPNLNQNIGDYDKIVVVSQWHKEAMHANHKVPLDKMHVIYNPIDARLYCDIDYSQRKKDRFIYCSSPDRALIPLLTLWPKILEKLPDATLDIYYGWRGCEKLGMGNDAHWTKRYQEARRAFERLRYQKGVCVHDMVSPKELADAFSKSGAWLYPVETFTETCCTNALEAKASGCIPVCPPLAALEETAYCLDGEFLTAFSTLDGWQTDFVDATVFSTKVSDDARKDMARKTIEAYSIGEIVKQWHQIL